MSQQSGGDRTPIVVLLNMQNEIVHADGHIGKRGNAARIAERSTLAHTAELLTAARAAGVAVYYVGNGYDEVYTGFNGTVPLFAEHKPMGGMRIGTWGTEFHETVAPKQGDTVIWRAGLGSFANSDIGAKLPPAATTRAYVAGVSTRLVVEAAVFEFTDRGFAVAVVEDCCAAASDAAHHEALRTLAMFARVEHSKDVIAQFVALATPTPVS
jgi:nicotinamidase-related amidase